MQPTMESNIQKNTTLWRFCRIFCFFCSFLEFAVEILNVLVQTVGVYIYFMIYDIWFLKYDISNMILVCICQIMMASIHHFAPNLSTSDVLFFHAAKTYVICAWTVEHCDSLKITIHFLKGSFCCLWESCKKLPACLPCTTNPVALLLKTRVSW